jgi:hypothetical protein
VPPIFREYVADNAAEGAVLRLVQGALRGALAGSLAFASGCASSAARHRLDRPEPVFDSPREYDACESFWPWKLSGVSLAAPFELVSVRRNFSMQPGQRPGLRLPNGIEVLSQLGSACRNPPDAACAERLRDARPEGSEVSVDPWFVTVSGSEIRSLRLDQLHELFGPIDTPTEALWFVTQAGYAVSGCIRDYTQATPAGFRVRATRRTTSCADDNVQRWTDYVLVVLADGTIETRSEHAYAEQCGPPTIIEGRRPPGLAVRMPATGVTSLGEHFARAAEHEAASIAAFLQLSAELLSMGAPVALVAGARRAAGDELRHARVMTQLARAFDGRPRAAVLRRQPPRAAFAIALDNAVEGCVHETYSGVQAAHQALTSHPSLRAPLLRVARDELRHAAWSWQLARWLEPRLPRAQRQYVGRARVLAFERMHAHFVEPAPALREPAGLPDLAAARRLAAVVPALIRG